MRARRFLVALAALLCVSAAIPAASNATSYNPFPSEEGTVAAVGMGSGATVHLFYSGTDELRRSLQIGDILLLTADGPGGAGRTRASIRVVSFVGRAWIAGEVVEGFVRVHDCPERNGVYFLVVPEALCAH